MVAKKREEKLRGRVVIAVSPKAGSGQRREVLPELIQRLESAGYDVVLSDQIAGIRAACLDRPESLSLGAVVAAGGDGTISLIADSLPAEVPLLPLPMGTENLLARHFGYTHQPAAAVAAIEAGQTRPIDAGTANGRLFLVMASCGFDAEVVRAMHLTRRGHIRRWTYAKPILRAVRSYVYPEIRVRSDAMDSPIAPGASPAEGALTCRWAMVFNLPMYGGGLRIEPDAIADDGKMDFVGLQSGCSMSTMRYLASVYTGRLKRRRDWCSLRGTRFHWQADTRVAYQLDGDYAGRLPVSIQTLPRRVNLLAPVE